METNIKLKPKQLEQISNIQNQKQQLNKLYTDLNEREAAVITLILEMNEIAPESVGSVEFKEDTLVIKTKEEKPKAASKKLKVVKD